MGLLWTASFVLLILFPGNALSVLLALATPLLLGWRLRVFRDYALEGRISFGRAYLYCLYTFFFAAILFGLVQLVYFRFLDHGMFAQFLRTSVEQSMEIYNQAGIDTNQLNESINLFEQTSPANLAFMFMMQNMVIGSLLSVAVAAMMKR